MSEIEGWIATQPEPNYGSQIQDFATATVGAEAQIIVTYNPHPVTLGDGTVVTLRRLMCR